MAATAVNAVLLALMAERSLTAPVNLWAAALVLLTLARIPGLLRARRRVVPDDHRHRQLASRFVAAMATAGLIWGTGAFIFIQSPIEGLLQTAYLVVLAGMVAGAATAFSPLPAAAMSFIACSLGLLIVRLLTLETAGAGMFTLLVLVFGALMTLLVLQAHDTFARYIDNLYRWREARGNLQAMTDRSQEQERRVREASDQMDRLQSQLRDQEAILSAVVNQAPMAVVVADAEGDIVLVQGQLANLAMDLWQLMPGSNLQQVLAAEPDLLRAMQTAIEGSPTAVLWEDGQQQLELLFGPLSNPQGVGYGLVAVLVDASEQYRVRQLQESFVTNVNHQLRTPLTSIMGYLELALLDELPAELRGYLDAACRNAHRMQQLVDQVGRLEREIPAPLEHVPVTRIESLAEALFNNHNQPSRCVLAIADNAPDLCVLASEDALRAVLDGLLKNAVIHAEPGSMVRLTLDPTRDKDGSCYLLGRLTNEGAPIPRQLRSAMFEKFTVGDNRDNRCQYGLGLGLFLCRRAAETCNGEVWLDRSDGQQTVFAFRLPAVVGSEEALAE